MFRETGFVVRRWVATSGKFATLVLDVENDGRHSKVDFVTFDAVRDFDQLTIGREVTVEGRIGMTKLTTKAREDVIIDNYPKYVPQLIVMDVSVAATSKKPETKATPA